MILEQALIEPRHVEVQVFGDQHGNLIYLGERDCSIQRRHQKVIEEAPCPVMTAELRQAMGEAALKAGRAVNYVGAGTVEFLLDARGQFYFLEMNTRLQVEHPVTELITGLDLVAWQLLVAEGQPLPLTPGPGRSSTAMPWKCGFTPKIRRRISCRKPVASPRWEPALQHGARIDHGLLEGQSISPFYDPMLGKLIAHGATREEARRKLLRAVQDTRVAGRAKQSALAGQPAATPAVHQWRIQHGVHRPSTSAITPACTATCRVPSNWQWPPCCFIRPPPKRTARH